MDLATMSNACMALTHCELTAGRALILIAAGGDSNMTDIATLSNSTTAAITGLVDGLESLGAVKRVHDRDDRRKINVVITSLGEKMLQDLIEKANEIENQ